MSKSSDSEAAPWYKHPTVVAALITGFATIVAAAAGLAIHLRPGGGGGDGSTPGPSPSITASLTRTPVPRSPGDWRSAFRSEALLSFASGVSAEPARCERVPVPATKKDVLEWVDCEYPNRDPWPYLRVRDQKALEGALEFYSSNSGNDRVRAGTVTRGTWRDRGRVQGNYATFLNDRSGTARLYWDQPSRLTMGVASSRDTDTEELKRFVFAGTRAAS